MHNVVCSQVESLKLMQERTKDEQQTHMEALQQLTASEEEDKQKVGKLLHVVMLARWQEAALQKKLRSKDQEVVRPKAQLGPRSKV